MLSCIIPAFNEEKCIGHCIDSIRLDTEAEIIVVANACTDNTAAVARLHGAKVIEEPQKGLTRARQRGYLQAEGALLAFIDADNIVPAGWAKIAAAHFEEPGVVAVSGPFVYLDVSTLVRFLSFVFYRIALVSHRFIGPMLQGGNFVIRASALDAAGGFNTAVEFYGEDTDTAMRLAKQGKIIFDPKLWIYSSSRRLKGDGVILTGWHYTINYLWMTLRKKPWSDGYLDHRPH
jgi:glycosyltransferase involved in cell wall biosynthesis